MDTNELYNLIGQNIKKFRKSVGETQEQFAKKNGLSRGFISQLESLKVNTGISLETLFNISKNYNVDITIFFETNN